ncbi:class I SAM-dependent methyltransferase [Goodfellowiella coeruleoviolacea]|uniref:Methyltransferase domain-containing protein n=1 Tax=Goodfellowiella coeruleoviolacea TaxID=334858 RepID=A0AAE3KJD8_9PSEU|nr:class I SAM-dependent methyltransferase [Goodfellowiella coeruleoviolacea]MCP2169520.1 Methyltransferase domain-containing protein [Goodfellowiella coeruleoviolacea]
MALLPDAADSVRVLDVTGADYRRAFELFLAGTDEKVRTHEYLNRLVERLPRRTVFLDVGAGEGGTTGHLARYFARTVAVEPSAPMREALRRACPTAEIHAEPVHQLVLDDVQADLALCSHVLYYLPESDWVPLVRRVLTWVSPGGTLVLLLQAPDNDCMRMVAHFTGARFDLPGLAGALAERCADLVADTTLDRITNRYRTTSLADAVQVAEFMLNVPALAEQRDLPSRQALRDYVTSHFTAPDGTVTINHAHDILLVHRSGAATTPGSPD